MFMTMKVLVHNKASYKFLALFFSKNDLWLMIDQVILVLGRVLEGIDYQNYPDFSRPHQLADKNEGRVVTYHKPQILLACASTELMLHT